MCPHRDKDSNLDLRFRRPLCCPLHHHDECTGGRTRTFVMQGTSVTRLVLRHMTFHGLAHLRGIKSLTVRPPHPCKNPPAERPDTSPTGRVDHPAGLEPASPDMHGPVSCPVTFLRPGMVCTDTRTRTLIYGFGDRRAAVAPCLCWLRRQELNLQPKLGKLMIVH